MLSVEAVRLVMLPVEAVRLVMLPVEAVRLVMSPVAAVMLNEVGGEPVMPLKQLESVSSDQLARRIETCCMRRPVPAPP